MNRLKLQRFAMNETFNEYSGRLYPRMYKPSRILIDLTYDCNLRCRNCDIWKLKKILKNIDHTELSAEELKGLILYFKKWLGTSFITLSGGEPMLRKDIFELINCASGTGITNLITNGTLLDRDDFEILNTNLDMLTISLDGITPKTHDYLRGKKGTYNKIMSNIEQISEISHNKKIKIATVLMGYNSCEIVDLIKWAKSNYFGILFQQLSPNFGRINEDELWYEKNKFWPDDCNEMSELIDEIISMKKRYPIQNSTKHLLLMKEYFRNPRTTSINCSIWKNFKILANGRVLYCPRYDIIGNMKKQNPRDVWFSEKGIRQRRLIKNCKSGCAILNCNYDYDLKDKISIFLALLKSR
ncbi:MAG: radical SAM protein [Candidatus Aenigmatarchaeota archaeon]